jgi:hypothetical protein
VRNVLRVAAILTLLALVAPAQAAEPTSTEMTSVETANANVVVSSEVETGGASVLSASGCSWVRQNAVATSALGVHWRVSLRGDWCWRNSKVTSVSWNKSKFVNTAWWNLWVWNSWQETQNGGGVGQGHVFRRVNAFLQLCMTRLGCVDSAFPWVQLTLRDNGTSAGSSGW